MRQNITESLNKKLFLDEYTTEFVDKWDELIDWKGRYESEGGFFPRILKRFGTKKVLDIACGTGFHTVTLSKDGFDVAGADGSANMLDKAAENAKRFNVKGVRLVEADWLELTKAFSTEKFDAIICLGNAFTHLFAEEDRVKALGEIYKLLNDGGIAIIDQRNYDKILDKGFHSKHQIYYVGETVAVSPEDISDQAVKFRYEYTDGSVHRLTLCPIRQEYVTNLLKNAGFNQVERYGDFEAKYDFYEPDFVIQVAQK